LTTANVPPPESTAPKLGFSNLHSGGWPKGFVPQRWGQKLRIPGHPGRVGTESPRGGTCEKGNGRVFGGFFFGGIKKGDGPGWWSPVKWKKKGPWAPVMGKQEDLPKKEIGRAPIQLKISKQKFEPRPGSGTRLGRHVVFGGGGKNRKCGPKKKNRPGSPS